MQTFGKWDANKRPDLGACIEQQTFAPEGEKAPKNAKDLMWKMERAETYKPDFTKGKNGGANAGLRKEKATIAREIEFCPLKELSREQQIEQAKEFCQEVTSKLKCAGALYIHDTTNLPKNKEWREQNPDRVKLDCHLVISTREWKNGELDTKTAKGKQAPGLAFDKWDRIENQKVSDGEKTKKYESKAIKEIRGLWQDVANKHMEKGGRSERVDCRSYEDQGIDRIPQKHNGKTRSALEAKGQRHDLTEHNQAAKTYNATAQKNEHANMKEGVGALQKHKPAKPTPPKKAPTPSFKPSSFSQKKGAEPATAKPQPNSIASTPSPSFPSNVGNVAAADGAVPPPPGLSPQEAAAWNAWYQRKVEIARQENAEKQSKSQSQSHNGSGGTPQQQQPTQGRAEDPTPSQNQNQPPQPPSSRNQEPTTPPTMGRVASPTLPPRPEDFKKPFAPNNRQIEPARTTRFPVLKNKLKIAETREIKTAPATEEKKTNPVQSNTETLTPKKAEKPEWTKEERDIGYTGTYAAKSGDWGTVRETLFKAGRPTPDFQDKEGKTVGHYLMEEIVRAETTNDKTKLDVLNKVKGEWETAVKASINPKRGERGEPMAKQDPREVQDKNGLTPQQSANAIKAEAQAKAQQTPPPAKQTALTLPPPDRDSSPRPPPRTLTPGPKRGMDI